jgi:serine/threonine-protein kinase
MISLDISPPLLYYRLSFQAVPGEGEMNDEVSGTEEGGGLPEDEKVKRPQTGARRQASGSQGRALGSVEGEHMTKLIQLTQRWALGSQIGKDGFGRVFEAEGDDGRLAAAKLVPKEPGADRELLFEDLTGVRRVVPIIDSGEWDGNWVLVMPRATKSLRNHLSEMGPLSPEEAVPILSDVAMALADLQGRVIHRDIKPENVLFLGGQWCLSDFGIARYAEASTAPDTHKWAWSPPYNPPERWRDERAVPASDIYSLGVMAFEMLSGHWPFAGPDFRNQHINEDSPSLTGCPALLASLVTECLLKAADARPTAANLLARLPLIFRPSSPGAGQLQAANLAQVQRLASQAAQDSAARSAEDWRREAFLSATKILAMVAERLGQSIRDNAPTAVWQNPPTGGILGSSIRLGPATLSLSSIEQSREDVWSHWKPKFQVIAHAAIGVRMPPDRFRYEGRSHSLWFCDAQESGALRWYETAFMISPLIPKGSPQDPFALPPGEEAGKALGSGEFQVAWPFTPIEVGNDVEFLERWMDWFARAAQGQLRHPDRMPERPPGGSWRH